MMKKGYVFVILFSIIIATLQSLKYRIFIKKDLSEATIKNLIIQSATLFSVLLVCGLLLARYYYKIKDK